MARRFDEFTYKSNLCQTWRSHRNNKRNNIESTPSNGIDIIIPNRVIRTMLSKIFTDDQAADALCVPMMRLYYYFPLMI